MKQIPLRQPCAALAFAASVLIGWMAVASAQDTAECPFADTEAGSCRHAETAPVDPTNTDEATSAELVVICHRPGTPAQKTLFVASQATPAHMDHGDTPGPCGD